MGPKISNVLFHTLNFLEQNVAAFTAGIKYFVVKMKLPLC